MQIKKKSKYYLLHQGFSSGLVIGVIFFLLTFFSILNILPLYSVILFSMTNGGLAGLLIITLSKVMESHIEVIDKVNKTENELQATIGISKLTKLPLRLGGWAITGQFLENLVHEIYTRNPNVIVECGSGTSTLVTAACLKHIGNGKMISLDHEAFYANKTRVLLEREQLSEYANVITAPLKKYELKDGSWEWYGLNFDSVFKEPIQMLIVDGPPSAIQPLSRYPAIPLLKKYLADNCLIMLDDGLRKDEQIVAEKWISELSVAKKSLDDSGRGFWVIESN